MRYKVTGKITVEVTIEVEADSADEALEVAYDKRSSLTHYAGNYGSGDKLIGVDGANETVSADDEIEWTEAEELEEESN